MLALVLPRLGRLLVALLVSSFVIFAALYVAPGSEIAFLTGGKELNPKALAVIEEQYHLNAPFLERYWYWLSNAVQGDFGQSLVSQEQVGTMISGRVGNTFLLVAMTITMIVCIGVPAGILAGARGGRTETATTVISTIGLAIPSFVAAIVLISVFAVNLGWFPTFGAGDGFLDKLWHLTLPAVALVIAALAYVVEITRAAVEAELDSEHVQTARSRGLPSRVVLRRHVVRNAMIPITTVIGLTLAYLVAGVAVVEVAFGVNGIGALLIESVGRKDFAVVQAICLILVVVFVVINAVVDVIYTVIDPRLRASEGGG